MSDASADSMPGPTDTSAVELDEIRDIGLFGGLDDAVLEALVRELRVLALDPGGVVFRENDRGREMFVLLSGEMEVVKQSRRDVPSRVAVLGPGDWFGEMSILDVMPRSATVRAIAYSLPHGSFTPRGASANALYGFFVSHRAMCPKLFWFGTSSTCRARQWASSARMSAGVSGLASRQTTSCPAYANVCSM